MPNSLKIVYFGTSEFATPVFDKLLENKYKIDGIFTSSEFFEETASENKIKLFKPTSLKKEEKFFEEFKFLSPDICVVAAYGKIIPSNYLDVPKYGFINVHPSILPKYRGPSPVQTAVLNGDEETGVSIMVLDQEMDHGPLLATKRFTIPKTKYHFEIAREMFELGGRLLVDILPQYLKGEIQPTEQNHSQASFTKKFSREEGKINWNKTAEEIYDQIRALNPEPGTWSVWPFSVKTSAVAKAMADKSKGKQDKIFNIKEAEPSTIEVQLQHGSGTVVEVNGSIAVATKKCYLILRKIQLEGGIEMDAKAFVNGHPDFLQSRLE